MKQEEQQEQHAFMAGASVGIVWWLRVIAFLAKMWGAHKGLEKLGIMYESTIIDCAASPASNKDIRMGTELQERRMISISMLFP